MVVVVVVVVVVMVVIVVVVVNISRTTNLCVVLRTSCISFRRLLLVMNKIVIFLKM